MGYVISNYIAFGEDMGNALQAGRLHAAQASAKVWSKTSTN